MNQLRSIDRSVATLISTTYEGSSLLPVTRDEAKLFARIDKDYEDSIVDILIADSVSEFEQFTAKKLFEQTVTAEYGSEGYAILILPALPVVTITSVQKDGEDVDYELYGDRLTVDANGRIIVTYECGIYETEVIGKDKLGFLKWVATNFNDRENTIDSGVYTMPNDSYKIWMKHKRFFL